MIHVIAAITTAPGKREDLIAAFRDLIPLVRAEQGCIEYGTAVDLETSIGPQEPLRPDTLVVVEKWESLAALEAHLAIDHMIAHREKTSEFVTDISLQILEPCD